MSVVFDAHELGEYSERLLRMAQSQFPRDTRNFMGRAGGKFSTKAKKNYRSMTKKKTGNLIKGVSKGRPYKYSSNEFSVRVKNGAPHAHLLEHGHAEWFHHTVRHNFASARPSGRYVKGYHVMGKSVREFEGEFPPMAEQFIDKLLAEGKL